MVVACCRSPGRAGNVSNAGPWCQPRLPLRAGPACSTGGPLNNGRTGEGEPSVPRQSGQIDSPQIPPLRDRGSSQVTLLESIAGPRDLKELDVGPAARPGQRNSGPADRDGVADQRAPRAQPRRGRADHRAAPGVRLAGGQDRLRHRPPGLRAQAAHRAGGRVRHAAPARRAVRLPEPGRVRARPGGELARVHQPVLRRRAGQGVPAARRDGPHRGRGDRRRRADRRDGLGGAEQHRGGQGQPAGHRGQRQRPLLPADDRRAGQPPGPGPGQPAVRERAGLHQDHPAAHPGGRAAAVRRRCTA